MHLPAVAILRRPVYFSVVIIALTCTTCAPKASPPNILLITVDTLRADHMGIYGYPRPTSPNLDKWFSDGTVFERAYATSAYTPPSVLSILTGLLPQDHNVRYFMQYIDKNLDSVPKRLAAKGYQTAGIVSNFVLGGKMCGLDNHFEYYDDSMGEREKNRNTYERTGKPTTDAAIAWLRAQRDSNRPFFLWVHYMDPHGPYTPPPSFAKRFKHAKPAFVPIKKIPPYQRLPGVKDGLTYVDLYDAEIAYVDEEIHRLLQDLQETKLQDNTLVILSSDHGESMMEHERWFRHEYQVYDELLRVPLLIKGPGFSKAKLNHPVSIADIAPTILQAAGVSIPPHLYGQTLTETHSERIIFGEGFIEPEIGKWRCAVKGFEKWTALMPTVGTQPIEQYYYNLQEDPTEENPQPWEGQSVEPATVLLDLHKADPEDFYAPPNFRMGTDVKGPIKPSQAAIDAQEQLRALGYLD